MEPKKPSMTLAPDVAKALRFLADQRGVAVTEITPEPKLTYCGTCGRKFHPEQLTRHECEACRTR
jgi:uncharacterized OB-fold protein